MLVEEYIEGDEYSITVTSEDARDVRVWSITRLELPDPDRVALVTSAVKHDGAFRRRHRIRYRPATQIEPAVPFGGQVIVATVAPGATSAPSVDQSTAAATGVAAIPGATPPTIVNEPVHAAQDSLVTPLRVVAAYDGAPAAMTIWTVPPWARVTRPECNAAVQIEESSE